MLKKYSCQVFFMYTKKMRSSYRGLLKLLIIVFYATLLALGVFFGLKERQLVFAQASKKRTLLASYPYARANIIGYGWVSEPKVKLRVKYPQGIKKKEFLLDSGAMVSSLPYEAAEEMGVNLAFLPRQSFMGFGNAISYAYQGEITVEFKEGKPETLPVVFTESEGSEYLLGRHGFFDDYSVQFNHIKNTVEIYQ
jgi:hypothetical protein